MLAARDPERLHAVAGQINAQTILVDAREALTSASMMVDDWMPETKPSTVGRVEVEFVAGVTMLSSLSAVGIATTNGRDDLLGGFV